MKSVMSGGLISGDEGAWGPDVWGPSEEFTNGIADVLNGIFRMVYFNG